MNGMIMALGGFVAGLVFGLLIAWLVLSPLVVLIGMAVMLAGAFLPTLFRPFFATMIFGFLLSWIVSSGVGVL